MAEKVSVRAHAAILDGQIYRNCIVTYSPDNKNIAPSIVPFTEEIHSTTSYNGIIVFAPKGFTIPAEVKRNDFLSESFTAYLGHLAAIVPPCIACDFSPVFIPL